jgi:hypothetical protein
MLTIDRRASAALGLPMGVDERQIRADLPKPAPGFDDPKPLIINVQIAREIGEIMSCKLTFYWFFVALQHHVSVADRRELDQLSTEQPVPHKATS